jgi:hypothetical protein
MKLVVWKKTAKPTTLVMAWWCGTLRSDQHELWLDFMLAGSGDANCPRNFAPGSLMADKLGVAYGLRLPALTLPPAAGEALPRLLGTGPVLRFPPCQTEPFAARQPGLLNSY